MLSSIPESEGHKMLAGKEPSFIASIGAIILAYLFVCSIQFEGDILSFGGKGLRKAVVPIIDFKVLDERERISLELGNRGR